MKLKSTTLNAALTGKTSLKAGRHSDGRNLYLNVSPTGAMSWVFMWNQNGVRRETGLGSFTGNGAAFRVGLEEARIKADEVRLQLFRGLDPIAAKKVLVLAGTTFRQLLAEVIENEKSQWKAQPDGSYENEDEWNRSLGLHAAKLLDKPVAKIDEPMVLAVLKPIWKEIPVTADRIRYRIKKVIDLAQKKGIYTGENPASSKPHIDALLGKAKKQAKQKQPSMPFMQVPAFMAALRKQPGVAAKATQFTTLTAVRTDEARLAQWQEIDLDAGLWIVPAARMKVLTENDRGGDHVVPLSTAAIAVLRQMLDIRQPNSPFVFPGQIAGQPLGETALNDKITKPKAKGGMNLKGIATMHGMRASFRTFAAEKNLNRDAAELCLAHKIGKDDTERSYNRAEMLEERTKIMQAWADHCDGKSNVVHLQVAA